MRDIFLTNHSDQLFLDRLIESFKNCKEFKLTVSFIKKPGLDLIINYIEEALKRGVKGKIITSTYQNFTDTPSLTTFLVLTKKYPNFECHLDDYCFGHDGFHSKGYMFYYDDQYEIYVGSTNITYFALKYNIERNVSLTSSDKSSSFIDAEKAFDELWKKTTPFNEEKIREYERRLKITINRWDMDFFDTSQETTFKLNPMQQKALTQLMSFRASGAKKALVVAATGSGKTYLSVFDALNFQAQKLLFVVHSEIILSEAMKTFQAVFKESRTYGFFTGKSKDKEADFIFATNVTMAKHLNTFPKDYFDYIVIDECHHASASTYKSIINYFQPGFLLGLTATPERTDDEDIFDLFDENLPFVLSLRDAIVNKLIVPFHYYGVRVKSIDYNEKNFKNDFLKQNNIDFCINEINKHAPATKLKCIAFCKDNEHAKKVSRLFDESGFSSVVLNASSSQAERAIYISKLENELDPLKIICAVDVLNEGVDIPSINMVLFLRPTDSSIIFLQQLGRGLRKSDDKEYLTVLDFIGNNYKRSTQIALGLASLGRTTYLEKDYVKQLISTNFSDLGLSGVKISLDRESMDEILSNINNENFYSEKILKSEFDNFSNFINATNYPSHTDYLQYYPAPDLIKFMKASLTKSNSQSKNKIKNKSYYNFLKAIGIEDLPIFSDSQLTFINTLSDYLPLVRPDTFIIIRSIINNEECVFDDFKKLNPRINDQSLERAINKLKRDNLIKNFKLNVDVINEDFKTYILDLLNYGLRRYEIDFGDFSSPNGFKLYANYYKEQVLDEFDCRQNQKGTHFFDQNTVCFITINPVKSAHYKNKFINQGIFQWESESNTSDQMRKNLRSSKKVHLFIRKTNYENKVTVPFTYFGTGHFDSEKESFVTVDGKKQPTLLFNIILDEKINPQMCINFDVPYDHE